MNQNQKEIHLKGLPYFLFLFFCFPFACEQNSRARFTMIFQLGKEDKIANVTRPTINDLNASSLAQIAQSVASTGQLVNIVDVNAWVAAHPDTSVDDEVKQAQVILSMPIINGQKNVIGVVQLINKVGVNLYLWLKLLLSNGG